MYYDRQMSADLPLPPIELMRSVGPTDPAEYDNPKGLGVLDGIIGRGNYPNLDYSRVLDFGCGCGRLARQMMQQATPPAEYIGVDLNPASVAWCSENLSPRNPAFRFAHLDIYNMQFNPGSSQARVAFPADDGSCTLVLATSVFTHILERDVEFYLGECARVLAPYGVLCATWFLFDKRNFPVMQEFQNALYIQVEDPTNAVWFDHEFLKRIHTDVGLTISFVRAPIVRGFQYVLVCRKAGGTHVAIPADLADIGLMRPPISMFAD